MNLVKEALKSSSVRNGEEFDCLPIIEKLCDEHFISWHTYHQFISEERNFGSIPGMITDGKFEFPFNYDDEMFHVLSTLINYLLIN